ncbi:MAG: ATP synthase F1 subunit delta [Candidatus Binatia bacterium]
MIEGSLSRRYAKALFQLARENHREEETGQEIKRFLTAYATSPLATALNNPAFGRQSRKNIVAQVAKSLELASLVVNFLSLLLERNRLIYLPSIESRYHRLLDEAKGRVEARVVATSALGDTVLAALREVLQKISGREVVLREENDPGLLGGVLIQLEGRIYDGSVRTQLEKLKEHIEQGS